MWGCRALDSVIDANKSDFKDKKILINNEKDLLHHRPYEWRLNMQTGEVKERNLTTETELSMDFPMINPNFIGLKNTFGYTQVVDTVPRTTSGDCTCTYIL